MHKFFQIFVVLVILAFGFLTATYSQTFDRIDRERASQMLSAIKGELKKNYYDPTFGGIDIDARFKTADEKLKNAQSLGQAFGIIAQAVMDLNDSHTRFYPPSYSAITDYGWHMGMFGDNCLVTIVRPGSDAEKKGLKEGDQILSINDFKPNRKEFWKMAYYYNILRPQTKLNLSIKSPDEKVRAIEVNSDITQLKSRIDLTSNMDLTEAIREGDRVDDLNKHYFRTVGHTCIWKMPTFAFDPNEVDSLITRALDKPRLILDLRGNPGGYVVTLEKLAGYFFDRDVKIADLIGRKKMDPQKAKSEGSKVFKGDVIVLVDSGSASASEIFARLMQIEQRGVVVGDVSAGAVMQSQGVSLDVGSESSIRYGMNMTNADVVMSDGKSLEHVGVQPNLRVIPTGADLATSKDPVMAAALELFGEKVTPLEAGQLFPKEKYFVRKSNIAIRLVF